MPKIIHENNAICYDENDEKVTRIVRKLIEKFLSIHCQISEYSIFQELIDSRKDPLENFKQIENTISVLASTYRLMIDGIISNTQVNMSHEMLIHMALSKLDLPAKAR